MSLNRALNPIFIGGVLTRSIRGSQKEKEEGKEESALSRRFEALAEDSVLSSPHKTPDASTAAAISEDLKAALTTRIAAADFASKHAQAISVANLPSSASKHTRDLAAARPWDGNEAHSDAVLRMLTDVHKPLRQKPVPQTVVDLRPSSAFAAKPDRATRVAGARDRTLDYAVAKDPSLSAEERDQMRQMFRERFQGVGGRPVASVSALMSLADQRIEDARARGQFDNIPRGKPRVEDHNASSPFLDTTEYFLNKMIRKQEILPPWVEKQQELNREVEQFRRRLKNEWKRFVALTISSKGGTLEEQCAKAEELAKGEARKARLRKLEKMMELGEDVSAEELAAAGEGPREVFRDSKWEKKELKFVTLAIENLNQLCRSYNMMAPEVARKPIFTLERELGRCFTEVAPEVAQEIRDRAVQSRSRLTINEKEEKGRPGLVDKFVGDHHQAKIYDSEKPNYGFRDFLRDLFRRKEQAS
ncbi:hypothetical protein FN846DRAFT_897800 [Sphaerosporella brunnea]|uniref:DnaJ homologue subfamily C member 28 conserved domain-containing protein n=1 Tax=Sphaerosporella brunnea TaxID=1250544 RepID=A0A5J5F3N6_9PEZI|nr:hypothetical protein FN846DRAFT_897800 [Sphaerosporella brunnea]